MADVTQHGCEAYGFIEVFSGAGWVTKCMQANGIASCKFDINLSQPIEGKQDAMNILTDAGFTLFGFHTTKKMVICVYLFRDHLQTYVVWGTSLPKHIGDLGTSEVDTTGNSQC